MRFYTVIIFSMILASCSSAKKEKEALIQKVNESKVDNSQSLGQTIHEHIEQSKTLSEVQKTDLRNILGENKKLAEELIAQSYKTRGVLIQELLSGKSTPRQVRILEKEIQRIEKLRLKNTFDTVKKISKIVSGQPDANQFAQEMLNIEVRGGSNR